MFCLPIKALGLLVSVIAQQPSLIQLEVEENKPLLVNKKQQTICEEIFYLNMTNTVLNFFVALLYQTKEVMFCHLVIEKPELNFTCIILHYGLLERCCSYLVFWMFQHAKCDRTIPWTCKTSWNQQSRIGAIYAGQTFSSLVLLLYVRLFTVRKGKYVAEHCLRHLILGT